MRVRIAAVGRLRKGPEAALIDDYRTRFDRTGRAIGLGPLSIHEIEDRKVQGMRAEGEALSRAVPAGARIIAMDERGKVMTSPEFSALLARWRDTGVPETTILIGGADGLDPELRQRADHVLSLGKMVWPHMLARVMLTEQLYRAATILTGGPYHRE